MHAVALAGVDERADRGVTADGVAHAQRGGLAGYAET